MRFDLMQSLACPMCHGPLKLRESNLLAELITAGALTCAACHDYYPILDGIPRMLTYSTDVARRHASEQDDLVAGLLREGFRLPSAAPPEGEAAVLRNFSREWTNYQWTGESYWSTTPEHILRWIQYALGVERHPLKGQFVLEVGVGIGGIADALTKAEDCDIIGVDLSYAVDQAQRYFGRNPRLHLVQASAFALPFRPGTFDTVYSQGVLHHTYSTRAAFDRLAPLVKPDGMFYVWLYSKNEGRATLLRRTLMAVENVVRPVLARLPGQLQTVALLPVVPLYMLYQNVYRRARHGSSAAHYGINEALHAARDRLTPPFAHRHTYDEVAAWYREAGFRRLELLRDELLPDGVPNTMQTNVGVRGFH